MEHDEVSKTALKAARKAIGLKPAARLPAWAKNHAKVAEAAHDPIPAPLEIYGPLVTGLEPDEHERRVVFWAAYIAAIRRHLDECRCADHEAAHEAAIADGRFKPRGPVHLNPFPTIAQVAARFGEKMR